MLPLRDLNPTRSATPITWAIIAIAAAVYFFVQPQGGGESVAFLFEQATIPCEVASLEPLTIDEIETGRCNAETTSPEVFPDKNVPLSLLVAIFLHGGVLHLLGNLWILFIFGNNIEEDFGPLTYSVFYLVAGLAASIGHIALHIDDTTPVVGASGAIAGVMGAYLVLHPKARVVSIVPPLYFLPFRVPAALYLVVWFGLQFLLANQDTNIAWEAHVVGFVVGLVVAFALRASGFVDRRRQRVDARATRRGR